MAISVMSPTETQQLTPVGSSMVKGHCTLPVLRYSHDYVVIQGSQRVLVEVIEAVCYVSLLGQEHWLALGNCW